jgi:hypothetical protein
MSGVPGNRTPSIIQIASASVIAITRWKNFSIAGMVPKTLITSCALRTGISISCGISRGPTPGRSSPSAEVRSLALVKTNKRGRPPRGRCRISDPLPGNVRGNDQQVPQSAASFLPRQLSRTSEIQSTSSVANSAAARDVSSGQEGIIGTQHKPPQLSDG